MRVRSLLLIALWCGVSALASAQAMPDVKLPPSPAGQAAIQVGGWPPLARSSASRLPRRRCDCC